MRKGISSKIFEVPTQPPKANFTAVTDPTVNDDSSQGYTNRSEWYNTLTGEIYRCVDSSVGAADWVNTSLTLDDLSTVALTGDYNDLVGAPVLADVATSGDYNDLSNAPTLPSGTNKMVFMNGSGDMATDGNLLYDGSDLTVTADLRLYGYHLIQGSTALQWLYSTGGSVDERLWGVRSSSGNFQIVSYEDSGSFGAYALSISRTGTTVDDMTLYSDIILNGDISKTGLLTLDATTGIDLAYNSSTKLSIESSQVNVNTSLFVDSDILSDDATKVIINGTDVVGFYASGVFRVHDIAGSGTEDVHADSQGDLVRITSDERTKRIIGKLKHGLEFVLAASANTIEFFYKIESYNAEIPYWGFGARGVTDAYGNTPVFRMHEKIYNWDSKQMIAPAYNAIATLHERLKAVESTLMLNENEN